MSPSTVIVAAIVVGVLVLLCAACYHAGRRAGIAHVATLEFREEIADRVVARMKAARAANLAGLWEPVVRNEIVYGRRDITFGEPVADRRATPRMAPGADVEP